MKKLLLLLSIAIAGCGPKTNEDIAKDLIAARLKTSLPDFNSYEGVNYGTMGKAFLPYEESDQYVNNTKALNTFKDSVTILKQLFGSGHKERLVQLLDSVKVKSEIISSAKMAYVPEQLFKLTHAYKVKEKSGIEKTTEEAFYFDKNVTKIVKVEKIY